jgi:hypothetical protein
MNPVKTMSGVVTRPVHTAASMAGRAIGLSIGATKAGVRTTGRLVEWAADRGLSAPEATPAPASETPAPASQTPSDAVADRTVVPEPVAAPVAAPVAEPEPAPEAASAGGTEATSRDDDTVVPPLSEVPTPADVKPAIDRSAPLEAEPAEADEVDDVLTASGIPAAGVGVNPATGEPNRYDTEPEPLLEPGAAKAVRSETDVLRRAAEEQPAEAGTTSTGTTSTGAKPAKKTTKKVAKKG